MYLCTDSSFVRCQCQSHLPMPRKGKNPSLLNGTFPLPFRRNANARNASHFRVFGALILFSDSFPPLSIKQIPTREKVPGTTHPDARRAEQGRTQTQCEVTRILMNQPTSPSSRDSRERLGKPPLLKVPSPFSDHIGTY